MLPLNEKERDRERKNKKISELSDIDSKMKIDRVRVRQKEEEGERLRFERVRYVEMGECARVELEGEREFVTLTFERVRPERVRERVRKIGI